jgi:hypothetical protein
VAGPDGHPNRFWTKKWPLPDVVRTKWSKFWETPDVWSGGKFETLLRSDGHPNKVLVVKWSDSGSDRVHVVRDGAWFESR